MSLPLASNRPCRIIGKRWLGFFSIWWSLETDVFLVGFWNDFSMKNLHSKTGKNRKYVIREGFFLEEVRVQGQNPDTAQSHRKRLCWGEVGEAIFYQQLWKPERSYTSLFSVHRSVLWEADGLEVPRYDDGCHYSSSELSLRGQSWGRKGVLLTCRRREALLFEFQSPDMLRPPCPSFTLLITRWWGGQRWGGRGGWGWWSGLRDLHLETYDIYLYS